jgi:hypothetical protein
MARERVAPSRSPLPLRYSAKICVGESRVIKPLDESSVTAGERRRPIEGGAADRRNQHCKLSDVTK